MGFSKIKVMTPLLCASFLEYLNMVVAVIVFPVLLAHPQQTFLPASLSLTTKTMLIGFILTIYYLGQFFAEPVWGNLSDRFGRKKIMCITLLGTCVSLLLTAIALDYRRYFLIFLSRGIAGLFAVNIALSQSSMADMSNASTKVSNLSLVEGAIGLGIALGGLVGGMLTNVKLSRWFGLSTPFWLLACFACFTFVLVLFLFQETLRRKKQGDFSLFAGLYHMVQAFMNVQLREIFVVWIFFIFGWNFYSQFFSTFLLKRFDYGFSQLGMLFVYAGSLYMVIQLFLVRPLSRIWLSKNIVLYALPLVSLPSIAILCPIDSWVLYLLLITYLLALAFLCPNLVAVISGLAHAKNQGQMMGMMWSIQACAMVLGTFLGSFLIALNPALPLFIAGFFIAISWVMYLYYFKSFC